MATIHPTAIVSPDARLDDSVTIGPFSVIEGPVRLHEGCRIGGHCWISGDTTVGPHTSIGWGSVIGADPQDLSFDPAVPSGVVIGSHNRIREHVTIHRGSKPDSFTTVGDSNFLMTGVHLAHDVHIGNRNILANNVLLAGHVRLGDRAFLGGSSVFHQFIRIGSLALVQGQAAISQDVPPYCTIYGNNYLSGLNIVGLRRAGFSPELRSEIKHLYHLLFLSGKARTQAIAHASTFTWSDEAALLLEAVASPSGKGVASP